MAEMNWTHFVILVAMAIGGICAIIPYSFELNKDKLANAPLSLRQLAIMSVIQGSIIFVILTFIGLLATQAVGLSVTSSLEVMPLAIGVGIVAGSAIIALEVVVFRPHLPPEMNKSERQIALWKRFLASFYGGVNEEIMTRLFLVSAIAWLLSRISSTPDGLPTDSIFALSIVVAAIVFGLGHLPATAAMTRLTPFIILRGIVLNAIAGLMFGWLFWQHGLVAGIIAHFCADIVLHIIAPMVMHADQPVDNVITQST